MFDNVAEWPDELAFRRGDLLRVLDERPGDGVADGWWLCADQRGRRGIVPANRLRMMHRFGLRENRVSYPHGALCVLCLTGYAKTSATNTCIASSFKKAFLLGQTFLYS